MVNSISGGSPTPPEPHITQSKENVPPISTNKDDTPKHHASPAFKQWLETWFPGQVTDEMAERMEQNVMQMVQQSMKESARQHKEIQEQIKERIKEQ